MYKKKYIIDRERRRGGEGGKKFRILILDNIFVIEKHTSRGIKLRKSEIVSFIFVCDYFAHWHFIEIQRKHVCTFRKLCIGRDCVQTTYLRGFNRIDIENLNTKTWISPSES